MEIEIRFYVTRHLSGYLIPVLEFQNPEDIRLIHLEAYNALESFLVFFRWLLNEKAE